MSYGAMFISLLKLLKFKSAYWNDHQYDLIFVYCRLGIDEELVALLGKHSPVGKLVIEWHIYDFATCSCF